MDFLSSPTTIYCIYFDTDAASDYEHAAIPNSLVLSPTEPWKCLRIPILANEDGHERSESFEILLLKPLDRYSKVDLPLGAITVRVHEECQDGELRLVNGTREGRGTVEICSNGKFGTVCGSGWTAENTYVACKQAGYIPKQGMMKTLV